MIILFDNYCVVKNGKYYNVLKYNEEKLLDENYVKYEFLDYNMLFLEKEDGSIYYFKYE